MSGQLSQLPVGVILALKSWVSRLTDSSTPLIPFIPKPSTCCSTSIDAGLMYSHYSKDNRAHPYRLELTFPTLPMAYSGVVLPSPCVLAGLQIRA
jgi:hypothetical protein